MHLKKFWLALLLMIVCCIDVEMHSKKFWLGWLLWRISWHWTAGELDVKLALEQYLWMPLDGFGVMELGFRGTLGVEMHLKKFWLGWLPWRTSWHWTAGELDVKLALEQQFWMPLDGFGAMELGFRGTLGIKLALERRFG